MSTLRILIVRLDFFILYRQGITFVFDILMLLKSSMTSSFSRKCFCWGTSSLPLLYLLVYYQSCYGSRFNKRFHFFSQNSLKSSILENTTCYVDHGSPLLVKDKGTDFNKHANKIVSYSFGIHSHVPR